MFVVYDDGRELIITTKKRENLMLEEFFGTDIKHAGRDVNDYDRSEIGDNAIQVVSNLRIR